MIYYNHSNTKNNSEYRINSISYSNFKKYHLNILDYDDFNTVSNPRLKLSKQYEMYSLYNDIGIIKSLYNSSNRQNLITIGRMSIYNKVGIRFVRFKNINYIDNLMLLNINLQKNFLNTNIIRMAIDSKIKYMNNLPNSIEMIHLIQFINKNINNFPFSLNTLIINYDLPKFNKLPNSVKKLIYRSNTLKLDNIPNSIKELQYDSCVGWFKLNDGNLDLIPEGIEIIKLPPRFDTQINDLPSSVKEIWIYCQLDKKFINSMYHHKVKIYNLLNYDELNEIIVNK